MTFFLSSEISVSIVYFMRDHKLLKAIFLFCGVLFFGTTVLAQTYWCEVEPNGFQHAAGAARISKDDVASWMPRVFSINSQKATLYNKEYGVSGGDRISTFQIRNRETVNGVLYNDIYYVKINAVSKKGILTLKSPGYYTIGPVKYSCEVQGNAKSTSVSNAESELKTEFRKLSQCNKKYLQQFLKGQGLYFGEIDGAWGKGTKRAVHSALKLPNFKNISPTAFFKKIRQNPICN